LSDIIYMPDGIGFVRLVDSMGDDQRIVDAARVSYGDGTKKTRNNAGLIDYLIRHSHSSPMEKVAFEFHVKAPIFVARQWMRHRTSAINEISARYSVMKDEFYSPDEWRRQAKVNRQGSEGVVDFSDVIAEGYDEDMKYLFEAYNERLEDGVAREMSRIGLPLSTYTEWYWTINLHNLFNFLRLRMDGHAQKEIQDYAVAVERLSRPVAPLAFRAFDNHVLKGLTLSGHEIEFFQDYSTHLRRTAENGQLSAEGYLESVEQVYDDKGAGNGEVAKPTYVGLSKGSRRELLDKVERLLGS